jgi:hypothetical protein
MPIAVRVEIPTAAIAVKDDNFGTEGQFTPNFLERGCLAAAARPVKTNSLMGLAEQREDLLSRATRHNSFNPF